MINKQLLVLACAFLFLALCSALWALDEAVLTPTSDTIMPAEEQEFHAAMEVWYKHKYKDGEKMLKEFSKKHPNSRWAAEADLHSGCYLTYMGRYNEAKPIFEKVAREHPHSNVAAKAKLRLGNIAERTGKFDEAIQNYTSVLSMNPTWDQFKYANSRARKLIMTRGAWQARINCGPVALAACLDALGKASEAAVARSTKAPADGISLAELVSESSSLGVHAQAVELPIERLKSATLPVLAHAKNNHFLAVLAVDGDKARIEDSIGGKREISIGDLERMWSGSALVFTQSTDLKLLSEAIALSTLGGCCGKADEDECLGSDADCACQQSSSGSPGGGSNGSEGSCLDCRIASPGSPTWEMNTNNLNLLVTDTPIWYNPGKGPQIAFTLTYSNENSNTGIFGRGWRCTFDQKVFFLPSDYIDNPDLQVHLATGRIETYQYNGSAYVPRTNYTTGTGIPMAPYGYRDTIEVLSAPRAAQENLPGGSGAEGTVMIAKRHGGKLFFKKGSDPLNTQGRIWIIQDELGNRVICDYDSVTGALVSITDANGKVTDVDTVGTGINERVVKVTLPLQDDGRYAEFGYTNGNLTSIKDMIGVVSTFSYNALLWDEGAPATTQLAQSVTTSPLRPANGGSLHVEHTRSFTPSGKIKINNNEEVTYTSLSPQTFNDITRGNPAYDANKGASVTQIAPASLANDITTTSPQNGGDLAVSDASSLPSSGTITVQAIPPFFFGEAIHYSSKDGDTLKNITRGANPINAPAGSPVYLCTESPYLSEIVTPSKKTKFTYEWWTFDYNPRQVAALHGVYECGPTESYPEDGPLTVHYAWCAPYGYVEKTTYVTRYPNSVVDSASGCAEPGNHWSGGLTKTYVAFDDLIGYILDESNNRTVSYEYNENRDRTSVTVGDLAKNRKTTYTYNDRDMTSRTDPLNNTWTYQYQNHRLWKESDPYVADLKKYTYNLAGQITKIEVKADGINYSTLVENYYDSQGRLEYSLDARGNRTEYHYEENGETRGFLTSVHQMRPNGTAIAETIYHYDSKGRRDSVTDPNGNITTYEYDDLDRVVKVTNEADSTTVETKYTCCHKVWVQDENGMRTYYVYDAKMRPYKEIASAASTTLDMQQGITPASPADGGSITVADASAFPTGNGLVVIGDEIIAYATKSGNTLQNITRGAQGTYKVSASFGDAVGRVDTVPVTYGYHPTYLYRKISVTDGRGKTTYYTYYDNDQLETVRYPDNTGERYTYDDASNMTKKEYGTFSGTYPNQTFTVDTPDRKPIYYEYDANNRLIKQWSE